MQILKEELIPAMVWIRDTHTGIVRTKKRGILFAAKETGADEDTRLRALALSNLTAIPQKTGIGTLFAYCGAKASCAAKIAESVEAGILGFPDVPERTAVLRRGWNRKSGSRSYD